MPTATLSKGYLLSLIGTELRDEELKELIEGTKMSLERVEGDELEIEVTTDRIDMLSAEGVARYLRGLLGIEEGLPNYQILDSDLEGEVSSSVLGVRPGFALAQVEDVVLDEESLLSLMHLQDKLDGGREGGWGRGRRKVSIGIHDLDKLVPPITYAAEPPESIKFVPLGESREMKGHQVLAETEKGRAFGHIIADGPLYPILRDSRGLVISLPPIINAEMTRVTHDTGRVLIDVTGLSQSAVEKAAVIVATSLAERGGRIGTARVRRPEGTFITPDMGLREMELGVDYFRLKSGLDLEGEEVAALLRKARLDAHFDGEKVRALIPPFRIDFLHEIDLVEEALIAYGYGRLGWEVPSVTTIGRAHAVERISRRARVLMVGLGYQEVLSYVITNPEDLFDRVRRPRGPVVEVANPVSASYTVLRDSLLPGLIKFLSQNSHLPYPQGVFEAGDVVIVDETRDTKARNERRIAAALADDVVGFEEIQSHLSALLGYLGVQFRLRASSHPTLIEGRAAEVIYSLKEGEFNAGLVGEVRPEIITSLGLRTPVGAFEVSIEPLIGNRYV